MTKTDPFTGKANTVELPITMKEYLAYRDGDMMIQVALPQLTADQREFLMTGIMPDSWDKAFSDE
jgi:hypothetical protein